MNNKIPKWLLMIVVGVGVTFTGSLASAETVEYFLNTTFPGPDKPPPGGSDPWATVTFDDGGTAGTVQVVIDLLGLTDPEFVGAVYFNYDQIANDLDFFHVSGAVAEDVRWNDDRSAAPETFKADGDGFFNVVFDYFEDEANRFLGQMTSVYDITGSNIDAFSFEGLSFPGGGEGTWTVAMHVQSIAAPPGSTWIGDGENGTPGEPIPEPATVVGLLGMVLTGAALFVRRRRKQLVD